jgi:caffeoyl-CoA O-methyltransferase
MSERPSFVDERLFEYIAAHTTRDDAFLLELKEAAKQAGIPSISIARTQASLMQILLRLCGAREVVEVGTLAGYSAIVMARALPPDGRVRTIEIEPAHADFAERWVRRSDVSGSVEVHRGRGIDVLKTFATDSADAAFLDADKESYPRYLEECLRIVRDGGLIMVDNALAFGHLLEEDCEDASVAAVRAFNELVPAVKGLRSVIVPLADGLWVGVKVAAERPAE